MSRRNIIYKLHANIINKDTEDIATQNETYLNGELQFCASH